MKPRICFAEVAALVAAMATYAQAPAKMDAPSEAFQAHIKTGIDLDLKGQYADARKHFAEAIQTAANPQEKERGLRSMAVSWAFEANCKEAARYETQVYDAKAAASDFVGAGEVANELARICIESGDPDTALAWYREGHDAALHVPDLKPEAKDLWDFRWEHAQARIAARRGNREEAQKHLAAAKAIINKGTNPNQMVFFPYLAGYVAFYGGDYKDALAEFQKANLKDPFILVMIAQTYEKMGDKTQAMDYYRKVLELDNHNPPNAFARPLARKKVG